MKLVRLLAEELGYGFRRIGSASRKTWPVVKINDFEISVFSHNAVAAVYGNV